MDLGIETVLLVTDDILHHFAFLSHSCCSLRLPWKSGWLEGAAQPFLVWKDHENLGYLKTVKRLNLRKAGWAIFFPHFNFTVT